jgi:hypothetical protein
VLDDGSRVPVGQVTLGTGHAPIYASAQAAAHYDNTGTAVADVRAGSDVYGIWVAGALRPGVTDTQVRALRGAALSGDWRRSTGRFGSSAYWPSTCPASPSRAPRPWSPPAARCRWSRRT